MRVVVVTAVLAAASLAQAAPARACSIVTPEVALPSLGLAPRDAHVWLFGAPMNRWSEAPSFALVATEGAAPSVTLHDWLDSDAVELVPSAPLTPGTRYEVWLLAQSGDRGPTLLGTFRTGAELDANDPAPPVLRSARQVGSICGTFLEVAGKRGSDVEGPVLYAVWLSDAAGHIAYADPPRLLAPWPRLENPSNDDPPLQLWGLTAAAPKLGIRTVDMSGRFSAPVEIAIGRAH
jgi:hypothetical protein